MNEITKAQQPSTFEQLVTTDRIADALEHRAYQLEEIAKDHRDNCTAAKLVPIGAIALSLPFLAFPGVGIMAAISGFMYGKTVWEDWQNSRKFCLFPGSRAGVGDILGSVGLPGANQSVSSEDLDEILDFLDLQQAREYKLLHYYEPQVIDLLRALPKGDRVSGYRYLLRAISRNGKQLPTVNDIRHGLGVERAEEASRAVVESVQEAIQHVSVVPTKVEHTQSQQTVVYEPPASPVEALPIVDDVAELESIFDQSEDSPEQTDLALLMAQKLTSRLVCAAPRTGKGLLIYKALCHLKRIRPDVEIWAIDIKADPGEDGYYSIFEKGKVLRIDLMGFSVPDNANQKIAGLFHKFQDSRARTKLLWINEGVTLPAKLDKDLWNNIKHFAIGLCSAGARGNNGEYGRFLWWDTQSPNVTDIGLKTNASRNVFRRVFLVNKDRSLYPSAVKSGFASGISEYELEELFESGSKVTAYDSLTDTWYALPIYEPPASDSRQVQVKEVLVQAAVQSGSSVNPAVQPQKTLNRSQDKEVQDLGSEGSGFNKSVQGYGMAQLSANEALNQIVEMDELGMNQTQIIYALWGARKGGSKLYAQALSEYKYLTGEN